MKHKAITPGNPNRRNFLRQTVSTGLMAGFGPLLVSCGGSDEGPAAGTDIPAGRATEARSYVFDLSNADPAHEFFLVAGTRHHRLSPATAEQVQRVKASSQTLRDLPSPNITHIGEDLPMSVGLQVCYVKSRPPAARRVPGDWHMHTMFYHVPTASMASAAQAMAIGCGKNLPTSLQSAFQNCVKGLSASAAATGLAGGGASLGANLAALSDNNSLCSEPQYDAYKDYFDHAMALVCNHPEVGSFDAPTLAYVQQMIVCADQNLVNLAASLYTQGPATTAGGWATLVGYTDPKTGKPAVASNGDTLYTTQYSPTTLRLMGLAIASVVTKVKNDPMLGANITGLDKSTANDSLQGKMWVTRDGTPTRPTAPQAPSSALQSSSRGLLTSATGTSYTALDVSSGNGYRVDNVSGSGRTVSFTVDNWYLRYLGLYIRFLDGAGQPIAYSDLPANNQQPFVQSLSGTYDCYLGLVGQEFVIFGVPLRQFSESYTITLPASAASIQILSGGLGSGTNSYPDTVRPGAVMTVLLDLAVPGLFLAMAAAQGMPGLFTKLSAQRTAINTWVRILILAISDAAVNGAYKDASVFTNLAVPLISALYQVPDLYAEIQASIAAGEEEAAVEDTIPFGFGLIFQAVVALGAAAQIIETSVEVANAPWTFVTQVNATHDLTVTLNHDPLDTQGFPETATYYTLRAVCDGGSPAESGRIAMPATTRTQPLVYTFRGLPSGGKVTVTAAFYSDTDWLAGTGATGAIDNTQDYASITIKENLVPLTVTTVYRHKQKISLDLNGNHIWVAGPQPPVQAPSCSNTAGSLCALQSIAVSESFGAVGYVWQAYSPGVAAFGSGGISQLYQFANISFTDQPESGWLHSGGGFTAPPRVAYSRTSPTSQNFYIDTSSGNAIVRRINMTAVGVPPTLDAPGSGKAVGIFNFSSDAFLIHPTGKLISINSARGKLEVLVPSNVPVADAIAPLAQVFAGPGTREGLLNGPVLAAIEPRGAILVLEQTGNRIQAFDTGANPTPLFAGSSTMALKAQQGNVVYLDMAVEFIGYIYVLSRNTSSGIYSMDIYTPAGALLATTLNMNVAKLAVDLFRNVFTLNFDTLPASRGLTQPSVSEWIPSTP